jgi:hypothetical protein
MFQDMCGLGAVVLWRVVRRNQSQLMRFVIMVWTTTATGRRMQRMRNAGAVKAMAIVLLLILIVWKGSVAHNIPARQNSGKMAQRVVITMYVRTMMFVPEGCVGVRL